MHILQNGIKEIKEKSFIKKIFCTHDFITGENCSSRGLVCISGNSKITVCKKCGKVKETTYTKYK